MQIEPLLTSCVLIYCSTFGLLFSQLMLDARWYWKPLFLFLTGPLGWVIFALFLPCILFLPFSGMLDEL